MNKLIDKERIVYVVDDDPAVLESLDSLFRAAGLHAALFGSIEQFLAAERPDIPGCLVLDVRLPGRSGLDFQREFDKFGLHLPVVFITGHGDVPMSVRAMRDGAIDFLTKPFRHDELLEAIDRGVQRDRTNRSHRAAVAELRARYEILTPREQEIMGLVVDGMQNKVAAARLGLSEITIKVHRAQVMRKMEAKSLVDLVRMAERLGLVSGDHSADQRQ
jgi:FixJ family two-component response regulator